MKQIQESFRVIETSLLYLSRSQIEVVLMIYIFMEWCLPCIILIIVCEVTE